MRQRATNSLLFIGSLYKRTAHPFDFAPADSFFASLSTFSSFFVAGLSNTAGPADRVISEDRTEILALLCAAIEFADGRTKALVEWKKKDKVKNRICKQFMIQLKRRFVQMVGNCARMNKYRVRMVSTDEVQEDSLNVVDCVVQ